MRISIIIPVYNEEKTILEVLSEVKRARLPRGIKKEIIVVDDASTDKTARILRKIKGVKVFSHKRNEGKGAAVKKGFEKATGDILLIQDADLEYDPRYYPYLIEPILKKKTKVVYGSRLKYYPLKIVGKKRTPLVLHYFGNRLLSFITNILYGDNLTDMETGYKLFHKSVLRNMKLTARRFDLEPEITAKVLKRGYKILEVPIKVSPRGYDEGKKITWKDGFIALFTLIKYKFID